MNQNTYIELMRKKLRGKITGQEESKLNDWLSASSENEATAKSISKVWQKVDGYKEDYQPDMKAGLSKVMDFIDAEEAPPKVVQMPRRRFNPMAMAAVLAVLIGVAGVVYWYGQQYSNPILMAQTGVGETQELVLADGTKVWLNENSTFRYANEFDESQRNVVLKGEAFFDVAHNPEQPFVIQTNEAEVRVLGTSFNVRAYPSEAKNEVIVKTGKVRFQPLESDKFIDLSANESGKYLFDKGELSKNKTSKTNDLVWYTGKLQFTDEPLHEVLSRLSANMDIEFETLPAHLRDCPLNAIFDVKNQLNSEVVEAIKEAFQLEAKLLESNKFQFSGAGC